MRKAPVQPWSSAAAVEQGLDLAAQVGASATEALRARRDPAAVARRRQRAARRRVKTWSAASAATVAGGAGVIAIAGGMSGGVIVALVVLAAVLTACAVRAVRAVVDLRARTKIVNALPPPSPRRAAVVGELRPVMARLDGYSDGLRRLVGMIGLVGDDPGVRALRDEVIRSADATEYRLRARAADLSGLIRAGRRGGREVGRELEGTIGAMRREIQDGIADYGRLVTAANDAVHATNALARGTSTAPTLTGPGRATNQGMPAADGGPLAAERGSVDGRFASSVPSVAPGPPVAASGAVIGASGSWASVGAAPELAELIDQLRALAAGMRELSAR